MKFLSVLVALGGLLMTYFLARSGHDTAGLVAVLSALAPLLERASWLVPADRPVEHPTRNNEARQYVPAHASGRGMPNPHEDDEDVMKV